MLILSRACAIFHDAQGKPIFTVHPQDRFVCRDAPDAIRQDPLFSLMMADGSLEAVQSVRQKRKLEADPVAGASAEGADDPSLTKSADGPGASGPAEASDAEAADAAPRPKRGRPAARKADNP